MTVPLLLTFLLSQTAGNADTRLIDFTTNVAGEAVATIAAGCAHCDWSAEGREAVLLRVTVDGKYSQHVALTRGEAVGEYRIVLGPVSAGEHHVEISRDGALSAVQAGAVTYGALKVDVIPPREREYAWLSRAPILRARPGTVEKFSDFPLVMYAEQHVNGESGSRYQLQYTVIFTNEDGGTPTDRLMATWGRTTDIEFIYGLTEPASRDAPREEIQAAGHKWIPFQGPREGTHPILWVATENNMVADHGADDLVRFAPAPQLVALAGASREKVMDDNPWMYAVTSAEMVREHRIDPMAAPGSGHIVDPRRYITIEACGQVKDATLAFDIGVRSGDGAIVWLPTDTDPRFRIARGGCFRGGSPAPAAVTSLEVTGLRIRAYARPAREGETPPPAGSVVLEAVTKVFALDKAFVPAVQPIVWKGSLAVNTDGTPVPIPIARGAGRE
jgi:hypothetical protein